MANPLAYAARLRKRQGTNGSHPSAGVTGLLEQSSLLGATLHTSGGFRKLPCRPAPVIAGLIPAITYWTDQEDFNLPLSPSQREQDQDIGLLE